MTILRLVIAVVLMLMATYIVAMNWGCIIVSMINKRKGIDKHHSTVPLVSLILAGMLAYPIYPYTPKWWIGMIPAIDIGNWMFVIGLPVAIFQGMFRKEKKDTEPNLCAYAVNRAAQGVVRQMENNPVSGQSDPKEEPDIGTALLSLVFGVYLVLGAVAAFASGEWPTFLAPQLNLVAFLLGAFVSPVGVYISAAVILLIGLLCCCWAAFVLFRRLFA